MPFVGGGYPVWYQRASSHGSRNYAPGDCADTGLCGDVYLGDGLQPDAVCQKPVQGLLCKAQQTDVSEKRGADCRHHCSCHNWVPVGELCQSQDAAFHSENILIIVKNFFNSVFTHI